jgi:hypothetical protein
MGADMIPLGVEDIAVLRIPTVENPLDTYWTGCRMHMQSRKAGETCKCLCPPQHDSHRFDCVAMGIGCIPVAPFMSEREANRLGRDKIACPECKTALGYSPLGMEVEA